MKLMKCTREQEKDTGLGLVLICLIIEFLKRFDIEKFPHVLKFIVGLFMGFDFLLLTAIILLLFTMTIPKVFKPIAPIWFGGAFLLGMVLSRVILTLVFVGLVFPIGFIRKLMGKDAMRLKIWKAGTASVFVDRDHTYVTEDLELPY